MSVLALSLCSLLAVAPTEWHAGAAKADITPPTGFPLWGYAARHDLPSTGIHDRLQARALVLRLDEKAIALVSLDLGRSPGRDSFERIQARARKIGVQAVFLVGSHTHHGPVLELDDWPTPKAPYNLTLETTLIDLIERSARTARPARWSVVAQEVELNRNRHSKRPDAPRDGTLTVLRVDDAESGQAIATAVHFPAHPTMRPGQLLEWSADYPGPMAEAIEKATGAPCLFLQGAAGDLSPRSPAGIQGPDAFGRELARVALALRALAEPKADSQPSLKVSDEELRFAARLNVSNPVVKFALGRAFFPALVAAYEREYREGVRPHLTVALLDGRLGLVGISGEVFCGHALSLRRRARLDHALVLGYCNGYHQYFPTIEAASEGGYGTEVPVALAEIGAGERLVDQGLIRLYQMRGGRVR